MKKATTIITILIGLLCTACSEQAPYNIRDIDIAINVKLVSTGIVQVEFVPSSDAFYFVGIAPLKNNQEVPYEDEKQFMEKVLNRAYRDYIDWRYKMNEEGAPYIASFADHTLSYGKTEKYFVNLWPLSKYFIYTFVVDPLTQQYKGHIYSAVIKTEITSLIDVSFDMTIDRDWDFVYPLDSNGEIVSNVPYSVSFVDKETILEDFDGDTTDYFHKPAYYFLYNAFADTVSMDSVYITDPKEYCFGVSCRRHNGNDQENLTFRENVTYYAAICSADGLFQKKALTVYRFVWNGDNTRTVFKHEKDNIGYHW